MTHCCLCLPHGGFYNMKQYTTRVSNMYHKILSILIQSWTYQVNFSSMQGGGGCVVVLSQQSVLLEAEWCIRPSHSLFINFCLEVWYASRCRTVALLWTPLFPRNIAKLILANLILFTWAHIGAVIHRLHSFLVLCPRNPNIFFFHAHFHLTFITATPNN